jgi:hypothetical protein
MFFMQQRTSLLQLVLVANVPNASVLLHLDAVLPNVMATVQMQGLCLPRWVVGIYLE